VYFLGHRLSKSSQKKQEEEEKQGADRQGHGCGHLLGGGFARRVDEFPRPLTLIPRLVSSLRVLLHVHAENVLVETVGVLFQTKASSSDDSLNALFRAVCLSRPVGLVAHYVQSVVKVMSGHVMESLFLKHFYVELTPTSSDILLLQLF